MKTISSNEIIGTGVSFTRIRRITGYLVGDLDRWNNAKKSELKDRVTHNKKSEERCKCR